MHPSQVKITLNTATNNVARALIESGIASDRDEARVILAKVLGSREVRFMITKAAVNKR